MAKTKKMFGVSKTPKVKPMKSAAPKKGKTAPDWMKPPKEQKPKAPKKLMPEAEGMSTDQLNALVAPPKKTRKPKKTM